MTSEKIYKNTILFHIALFVISVLISIYPSKIVEEANIILEQNNWFFSNASSTTALLILIFIASLIYFYSLYGLYKFKKIGRTLYTYTIIFFSVTTIAMGNYAYSALEFFFYDITAMTNGALLIFIYLTDLKKKFK